MVDVQIYFFFKLEMVKTQKSHMYEQVKILSILGNDKISN